MESAEKRIRIYQASEGEIVFDVDFEKETIWATQTQMAEIFLVDKTVISRHLKNIYKEKELIEQETCQKENEIRTEGSRKVNREIKRYNLDAIISVGYRVNSKQATKFRIWSTKILKEYLTEGVAINEKQILKISEQKAVEKLDRIRKTMTIIERVVAQNGLSSGEASGVIEIMSKYTKSFQTISEYLDGHFVLTNNKRSRRELSGIEIENFILDLREKLEETEVFGTIRKERGDYLEFADFLKEQFNREDTVSKRAAKILYFIVKEEPFMAGNQQIGALLFVIYLTYNQVQLTETGETKISDRALTALVLLIIESKKEEKALLIELICKLLDN